MAKFFIVPNGLAMSSSGLTRKYFTINKNLTNNNNLTARTNTAITYSLCYAPFLKQSK